MPAQYTAMRDKFKKTMPLKAAKTKAAKIYNSKHKAHPIGPHYDENLGLIAKRHK